jgi:hypothetical protein
MIEVATAARQDGTARRDSDRIDESFRLACEALAVGVTYSSERIVDRARRFRREYTGPATSYVRDFDDQLRSARADLGGTLEAVIPAAEYREKLPEDSHPGYDALFARATAVHRLPFTESTPESHMAASKLMVDQADELYAVWDGKPARSYGGTADVVAYAREHGTPVRVIWPDGAERG